MTDLPERHGPTRAYARGDKSIAALAREIEAERRNVSQTIEALQEKFTIGNVIEEAWDQYGHHANELGRNLGQAILRNPLPVMLTAVGVTWLMMSTVRDRSPYEDDDPLWPLRDDVELHEEDSVASHSDKSGRPGAQRPYGTAATTGYYTPRRSMKDRISGAAGDAYQAAREAVDPALHRAAAAGESIAEEARDAAGSAMNQAEDAAYGARDRLHHATGTAKDHAQSALESGREAVESIGDTARHVRNRARRGAHEMTERVERYRRQGLRQGDLLMRDHPLLLGAAAIAVGAGIACLLPRSRTEDAYLGEYSDRAWRMARSEAEKARRVAGAVAEEACDIASEEYNALRAEAQARGEHLRDDLSDAAAALRDKVAEEAEDALNEAKSEAGEIAERLGDTAREEAENQGLVDPNRSS